MADTPPTPQNAALAMEVYQRQLDQVSRQIDFLQGVHDDIERARRSLEGIADAEKSKVLVPLGASTFVRGRVDDADKVIVGIGAGYLTERTRAEALARLETRAKEVETELERMMQAAVQLEQEAARLQESYAVDGDAEG